MSFLFNEVGLNQDSQEKKTNKWNNKKITHAVMLFFP